MDMSFRVFDVQCLATFALQNEAEFAPVFSAVRAQHWIDKLAQGCECSRIAPPDPSLGVSICAESICAESIFFACRSAAADADVDDDALDRSADAFFNGSPFSEGEDKSSRRAFMDRLLGVFSEQVGRTLRASVRLVGHRKTRDMLDAIEPPDAAHWLDVGTETPWPLRSVLQKLVEAAGILLNIHDYDGNGWEGVEYARRAGSEYLEGRLPVDVAWSSRPDDVATPTDELLAFAQAVSLVCPAEAEAMSAIDIGSCCCMQMPDDAATPEAMEEMA